MTREELNDSIRMIIREARRSKGLTQAELGSITKMKHSHISALETGWRLVPVNAMVKLFAALDITLVLNGGRYPIKQRSDIDMIVCNLTIADRKRKGMTYAEYAKLMGMSITVVAYAEKNKSKYSLTYLANLITASASTLDFTY